MPGPGYTGPLLQISSWRAYPARDLKKIHFFHFSWSNSGLNGAFIYREQVAESKTTEQKEACYVSEICSSVSGMQIIIADLVSE
jgi:hypothetical protein